MKENQEICVFLQGRRGQKSSPEGWEDADFHWEVMYMTFFIGYLMSEEPECSTVSIPKEGKAYIYADTEGRKL